MSAGGARHCSPSSIATPTAGRRSARGPLTWLYSTVDFVRENALYQLENFQ